MTADEIIALLGLSPHPEGGHYKQTWEADAGSGERAPGTCIYFLLKGEERSHWHRVDAGEIWHYYAGSPLRLMRSATDNGPRDDMVLGPDLARGQRPQGIVEAGHWQAAQSLGDWTLVGCTVSPGFRFEGFELAAPEFDITG
ncbi:cupin domain-containing protein [Mameliella alba]|uniref:cupin domain-containing protein n=1 Tax=Mameliella alba TaxID=561184 RepID=UPI000B52CFF8|nr:cupin domain-containing protein [Mameliella alba]MBY6119462.1 cupin domain-containing protein [Mameliella alba]OWV44906.1 cupin [Mameliella alba]OWV66555.1 cupin [Mameliella alba]